MSGRKIRLKLALPSVFASLITFTGLMIIVVYSWFSSETLRTVAMGYLMEISIKTLDTTVNHLEPAALVADINAKVLHPDLSDPGNLDDFNRITIAELRAQPHIGGIYLADMKGSFWMNAWTPQNQIVTQMVLRREDSEESRAAVARAEETAPNGLPGNREGGGEPAAPHFQMTWLIRDLENRVIDQVRDMDHSFDPRTRSWFKDAVRRGKPGWTNAYFFFEDSRYQAGGRPGVTRSAPIIRNGVIEGVVGVDIDLEELSGFLAGLKVGLSGRAFIISAKGELVALPRAEHLVVEHPENGRIFRHVTDAVDQPMAEAFKALHRELGGHANQALDLNGSEIIQFSVDGQNYSAHFSPFPDEFGLDWIIGVLVPDDDFLGPVKKNLQVGLGISVVFLVLVVWVSFFFTRQVTRPIQEMTGKALKIRELQLDELQGADSLFQEIDELNLAFDNMQTGLKSFRKYVPADLVRYLIHTGTEARLGGQKKNVTVWFADVKDFTRISEHMPPDELVLYLGRHMEEMSRIILGLDGTVDKYIGDAVMAFWNAPRDVPDQEWMACQAALQWRKKLFELNELNMKAGQPRFQTRIGINTGEVIVGNMGAEERLNYTVIGDPVNLASRLESLGKLYGVDVILGQDVHDRVKDRLVMRLLDRVAVKGRTQSSLVYELVGTKGDVSSKDLEFIEIYEAGLGAFFDRQFALAGQRFHQAAELRPRDEAVILFLQRIRLFEENPPPEHWDGACVMTEK